MYQNDCLRFRPLTAVSQAIASVENREVHTLMETSVPCVVTVKGVESYLMAYVI